MNGIDSAIPGDGILVTSGLDKDFAQWAVVGDGQGLSLILYQQIDVDRLGVAIKGRLITNDGLPSPDAGPDASPVDAEPADDAQPDSGATDATSEMAADSAAPNPDSGADVSDAGVVETSTDAANSDAPHATDAPHGGDSTLSEASAGKDAMPQTEGGSDAQAALPEVPSDTESGCGCRMVGSSRDGASTSSMLVGMALLAGLHVRRSRAKRKASTRE